MIYVILTCIALVVGQPHIWLGVPPYNQLPELRRNFFESFLEDSLMLSGEVRLCFTSWYCRPKGILGSDHKQFVISFHDHITYMILTSTDLSTEIAAAQRGDSFCMSAKERGIYANACILLHRLLMTKLDQWPFLSAPISNPTDSCLGVLSYITVCQSVDIEVQIHRRVLKHSLWVLYDNLEEPVTGTLCRRACSYVYVVPHWRRMMSRNCNRYRLSCESWLNPISIFLYIFICSTHSALWDRSRRWFRTVYTNVNPPSYGRKW